MEGPLGVCIRWALWATVVLLLCGPSGECCGPGRRGGRRRSPRKLMPLVYKEHVPNVDENTLGASGLTEGHISKLDPRFHELVPNYNSDIYFRDEEGTGEDRLMTERCKEKLNMLTISVMNQWPKVRLRVLDGWDATTKHAPNSLHYEGRAVDISTSDKDRSKLGMLARLAVEAGFDWVFYEARSHIHCSVKSESPARRRMTGCFPGQASVQTPQGNVPIGALEQGDLIQVLRKDGTVGFSQIRLFLHKDSEVVNSFLMLGTSSGTSLYLTPSHLIFTLRREVATSNPVLSDALENGHAVMAGTVRPGDYIMVTDSDNVIQLENVTSFDSSWLTGVYAPLTEEGTVIVNNVVASCYAIIDSQALAHWAFFPVRLYFHAKDSLMSIIDSIGLGSESTQSKKIEKQHERVTKFRNYLGIASQKLQNATENWPLSRSYFESKPPQVHWYASMLYQIASWILPNHLVQSHYV